MNVVFVSISSFDPAKHAPGEVNELPSDTVPDQVLSIQQLLDRHRRGQKVDGYTPVYESDTGIELPDIRSLDLTELEDLKRDVAMVIKEHRKKLKQASDGKVTVEKPINPLKQQEISFGEEAEPKKDNDASS